MKGVRANHDRGNASAGLFVDDLLLYQLLLQHASASGWLVPSRSLPPRISRRPEPPHVLQGSTPQRVLGIIRLMVGCWVDAFVGNDLTGESGLKIAHLDPTEELPLEVHKMADIPVFLLSSCCAAVADSI